MYFVSSHFSSQPPFHYAITTVTMHMEPRINQSHQPTYPYNFNAMQLTSLFLYNWRIWKIKTQSWYYWYFNTFYNSFVQNKFFFLLSFYFSQETTTQPVFEVIDTRTRKKKLEKFEIENSR